MSSWQQEKSPGNVRFSGRSVPGCHRRHQSSHPGSNTHTGLQPTLAHACAHTNMPHETCPGPALAASNGHIGSPGENCNLHGLKTGPFLNTLPTICDGHRENAAPLFFSIRNE